MAKKKNNVELNTTYTIDLVRDYLIAGNNTSRYFGLILLIFIILVTTLEIINQDPTIILPILALVISCMLYVMDYHSVHKLMYNRLKMNNYGKELVQKIELVDKGIKITNIENNSNITYAYDEVVKVVETSKLLVIFLKYKMGIPIVKDGNEAIVSDIKDQLYKNTNIKKIKRIHPYNGRILIAFMIIFIILIITCIVI